MKTEELENIIIKALSNNVTELELSALKEAIKIPENRDLFESYIQTDHLIDSEFINFESKKSKFLKEISTNNSSNLKVKWRKKSLKVLRYAALIVFIFLIKDTITTNDTIEVINENAITLELNDGTIKVINPDRKEDITNSNGFVLLKQDNDKLVYDKPSASNKETTLSYNKLYVPLAKKFQIELSDGTLVYLNSGSTLKYPVKFLKGQSREVFLDGEAYFVVSKDKAHPFIVNANEVRTQVYGTEFNISSYKNDPNLDIVLVEGSIGVYNNKLNTSKDQLILVPNEKASFNKKNLNFTKKTVNVRNFIAWKDGVLWFENAPFENIVKKLERNYNVSIENNYTGLNKIAFTGTFDIETIDQILEAFQSYKQFKYTITDNQITINK